MTNKTTARENPKPTRYIEYNGVRVEIVGRGDPYAASLLNYSALMSMTDEMLEVVRVRLAKPIPSTPSIASKA